MRFITVLCFVCTVGISGCQKHHARAGSFKRAIARTYVNIGESRLKHGSASSAEHAFREAIQTDPRNVNAHVQLASLYSVSGRHLAACEHLRAALRYEPTNFDRAIAYADCKKLTADFASDRKRDLLAATRAYCYARSLQMNDAGAALKLAECYSELNEHLLAAQTCEEGICLDPESSDAHVLLGRIYERSGYDEPALREYKEALNLDRTNVIAHNGAGRVNLRLAQCDESKTSISRERAAGHFRQSLEIEPNQPDIARELHELEPDHHSVTAGSIAVD